MKKVFYVIVAIALCLFVGWVSSQLNVESISSWYPTLNRSSLTPPAVAFPIVWSVLYVLIGISAGLLYGAHDLSKKLLLWLFVLQLFFNVSWNFLFFYLQSPIMGFVNLLVLDVLGVAYFIGTLWIRRVSAYFFLPYLLWLIFASYLNMYIMIFN